MDQSQVVLTWSPPKYLGGRNDTVYRVSCDYCPPTTNYVPSQENINDTKVVISGLNPMTSYQFQVFAENGVSGYDSSQFVAITVTTEASGKHSKFNHLNSHFFPKLNNKQNEGASKIEIKREKIH